MIAPLQGFLDGDMRNIMRERKILENKRLDLDAGKNKVRKARAMQMQPPVSLGDKPFFVFTDFWESAFYLLCFCAFLSQQKDGVDPRALVDQVGLSNARSFLEPFNPWSLELRQRNPLKGYDVLRRFQALAINKL